MERYHIDLIKVLSISVFAKTAIKLIYALIKCIKLIYAFFWCNFWDFSFKSPVITGSYDIIRLAQFMLTINMLKCINEQQIESQLKLLGE
jgi:hypothetical protein